MKKIMNRAWEIVRNAIAKFGGNSRMYIGAALKTAWAESKAPRTYKNVTVASFDSFNARRYSNPWVASVDENGRLDFNKKIGSYTGRFGSGEAGEIYIYAPVDGQIYGYGQKDHRGGKTIVEYVMFKNGNFVSCDKLGRLAA